MTHLFCLNELTVLRFVHLALRRRETVLLPIVPLFPFSKRFLQKLGDWAIARGSVLPIESLCPDLSQEWALPLIMQENIFEEIEPWQRAYYRFSHVEERLRDYAMAYKQVVSNYLGHRLYTMLAIRRAMEESGRENVHVYGLSPDLADAMEAYLDAGAGEPISPFWVPARLLNFFMTVAIIVYALGWVLSRSRLSPGPAKGYFFAADYIADGDDINFYEEIEDGGPILLVVRGKAILNGGQPERVARFEKCSISDGVIPAMGVPGAMWFVMKETALLYSVLGGVGVSLYYAIAALPFRRIVYRAFFNRYRPKVFWGRDLYNVEHILRRAELTRVGGSSWAPFHGYPTYAPVFPMVRYINLDRIYTISYAFHRKYYFDTWASDMKVVAGSTFRASRDVFPYRLQAAERTGDILVLCAINIREPAMVEFVRKLAAEFSERRVLLQIKDSYTRMAEAPGFIEKCTKNLDNIKLTEEPIYELLARTHYVFSDPSTVFFEAVQFGAYSFAIDVLPIHNVSALRDIPEICIETAEEAAGRIRSIENGSWSYPIETLADFVDLKGECFHDMVRRDLGLPVREAPDPVWRLGGNGRSQETSIKIPNKARS